jgi:hypothetical protein
VPRVLKGLKTTIAWLEEELGGSESTIPVPDLIAAMLERKEAEGDDLMLFLLFDPDNEDDVVLASAADAAGIQIRNLSAAGDFLEFDEPEPEVPVAPETETPPWEEVADAVAEAYDKADAAVPALPEQVYKPAGLDVNLTLDTLIKLLARAIVAEMASLGAQSVAAAHPGTVEVTPADPERPAEPGGRTEQIPGSAAFYYNSDKGTYRKARGMARDGETKVFLTENEQVRARAGKMLA